MPTKPTLLRSGSNKVWATDGEKTNPSSGRINTGYLVYDFPSHSELNEIFFNLYSYLDFIDVGGMTGIIRFDTIELLAAIDDTEYLDLQHFIVEGFGIYQLDQSDITSLADGENVIELDSGSRLKRIIFDVDTSLSLFQYKLSAIFTELEKIQNVKAIKRTVATLDFGSISANTTSELIVSLTGARNTDIVQVTPQTALNSGLMINAYVSAENEITVRIANVTASPINPSSTKFNIMIIK